MPRNTSRSFVVRIWMEPREAPHESFEWRGTIWDVLSGETKHFRKLEDMLAFMISILMDIEKINRSRE